MRRLLLPSALAGALAALGCGGPEFPSQALVSAPSGSGALELELRTQPQPPKHGNLVAQLTVLAGESQVPVDGLDVAVSPWMPAMSHGSSVVPEVTAEGGGRYRVTNLSLPMAGTWQLRVALAGADGGVDDSALLQLELE